MAFIKDEDRQIVQERLAEMVEPVTLVNFTQQFECAYCRETRQVLEEFVALSDKLSLEVYNFAIDKEKVEEFGVDKIPATIAVKGENRRIRWYGVPLGYEFATLLEDVVALSQGDSGLSPQTREELAKVDRPLHIQVFVTPTCPYCPRAVSLAHRFAMENELITADMVEATEFPQLAMRYHVRGVPRTVVNDTVFIEGAVPESVMLERVLSALEPPAPSS